MQVKRDAWNYGYILINPITGRKFHIEYFNDFQELKKKVLEPGFWDLRNAEKEKNSELFHKYYKPLSKSYFRKKEAIGKAALNSPIQGTAAEITKLAVYYIFKELIKRDYLFIVFISNLIHDEILIEAPENKAEEIAELVETSMIKAGRILGCERVPLGAEAKIVDWWNH